MVLMSCWSGVSLVSLALIFCHTQYVSKMCVSLDLPFSPSPPPLLSDVDPPFVAPERRHTANETKEHNQTIPSDTLKVGTGPEFVFETPTNRFTNEFNSDPFCSTPIETQVRLMVLKLLPRQKVTLIRTLFVLHLSKHSHGPARFQALSGSKT